MADVLCSVNDQRVTALRVSVPWSGVWSAEADFDVPTVMTGAANVRIGARVLKGTFDVTRCGTYLLRSKCHMHGGAASWDHAVTAKHYHNDAGVAPLEVITDLAAFVGETLGTITPQRTTLGVDFLRQATAASNVLAQVIGTAQWYVDDDGITHVGSRTITEIGAQYEVMAYDARFKVARVAADDIGVIAIGSILRDVKLERPLLVREIQLAFEDSRVRALCWGTEL